MLKVKEKNNNMRIPRLLDFFLLSFLFLCSFSWPLLITISIFPAVHSHSTYRFINKIKFSHLCNKKYKTAILRQWRELAPSWGEMLPWVPEDIFFLSILIVRGKAASTRLEAPRALLNCKHGLFHIRYFENGSLEQVCDSISMWWCTKTPRNQFNWKMRQ